MSEAVPMTPQEELDLTATLIRRSVVTISHKSPTSGRAVLDAYLRFISPSMAKGGDSHFPVPVRKHPHNPERTNVESGRYNLLCFHIGNAILAYYGACVGEKPAVTPELRRRAFLLGQVAQHGLEAFKIGGDIRDGFYLSNPVTDHLIEKEYGVPNASRKEVAVQPGAGGSGGASRPPRVQR